MSPAALVSATCLAKRGVRTTIPSSEQKSRLELPLVRDGRLGPPGFVWGGGFRLSFPDEGRGGVRGGLPAGTPGPVGESSVSCCTPRTKSDHQNCTVRRRQLRVELFLNTFLVTSGGRTPRRNGRRPSVTRPGPLRTVGRPPGVCPAACRRTTTGTGKSRGPGAAHPFVEWARSECEAFCPSLSPRLLRLTVRRRGYGFES